MQTYSRALGINSFFLCVCVSKPCEKTRHFILIYDLYLFLFCPRGRNVYIQFSSHQELTTMDQNTQGRGDEVGTFSIDIWEI